jgi:hypothetical protein
VKLSKARLEPISETQWSDKVKETLRKIKVGQGEVPQHLQGPGRIASSGARPGLFDTVSVRQMAEPV